MPPKEKPSKKAVKEKQTRVIEDATFGLKNRNKSKKVQEFIDRVEKTVKFNSGAVDAAKAKEAKKDAKLAKQLQDEELRVLFNEGIANQFGKKKSKAQAAAQEMGIAEMNKDVANLLKDFSSDDDSDDDDDDHEYEIVLPEEPVAVEVFREKTIEDIIEEQREKLAAQGKTGTPVTAESFAIWRAAKLAQKQADAEARMKLEAAKKKGGKGLSILSGKELFNYNSALFVDDEGALDATEESQLNLEHRLEEEAEEKRAMEEADRAQQEQQRLIELQQLEDEANEREDEERRALALADDHEIFTLGDVVINKLVFDVRANEDLQSFDGDTDDDEDDGDDGDEYEDEGEMNDEVREDEGDGEGDAERYENEDDEAVDGEDDQNEAA